VEKEQIEFRFSSSSTKQATNMRGLHHQRNQLLLLIHLKLDVRQKAAFALNVEAQKKKRKRIFIIIFFPRCLLTPLL